MIFTISQLYELVHALTETELEMVRLSVVEQECPIASFLEVFKNSSEFDEAELKKKLRKSGIRDLAAASATVEKSILKVITKREPSRSEKVNRLIQGVSVLYEKRQFDMCVTLLSEARNLAEEHEILPQMEKVLSWEKLLAGYNIIRDKDIRGILLDQIDLKEQVANYYDYSLLNLRVSQIDGALERGKTRSAQFREMLKNPLLQSESMALAPITKLVYHSICAVIYHELEIYDNAYHHYQCILGQYHQEATRIKNNLYYYLATVTNFAEAGILLKKYNEVLSLCEELKSMPQRYEFMKALQKDEELFLQLSSIELRVYNHSLMLESARQLIPSVWNCLENLKVHIKPTLVSDVLCELAESQFMAGNFEEVVRAVRQVYHSKFPSLDRDNQLRARFLEMLSLIELEDFDQLSSRFQLIKTWLTDKGEVSHYEQLFLDLIETILKQIDNDDYSLKKSYTAFIPLFEPAVKQLNQNERYLDMPAWLESKLGSIPFVSIIQEKINMEAEAAL